MKNRKPKRYEQLAYLMAVVLLVIATISCKKDKDDDPTPTPPTPTPVAVRHYDASATIGDIVSISVNENNKTIAYNNLTTGESGTVSYTKITSGLMKNALKIVVDGEEMYLLELPGQMLMTYLPFGAGVEMIVGVTKRNYTPGDHLGKWIFFGYDPSPFEHNYWGIIDVNTTGRFELDIWNFSGQVVHTETGNWHMDNTNSGVIYTVPDGSNDTIQETIFVLPDKLRIYDSGPQLGMGICFAEPEHEVTISSIAGTYTTVWSEGYGSFTINSNGTLTASFYVDGELYSDIQYNDFRRTNPSDAIHFNNTFFFIDHINPDPIKDVYVIVLPGDAILAVYHDTQKGMLSSMCIRVN